MTPPKAMRHGPTMSHGHGIVRVARVLFVAPPALAGAALPSRVRAGPIVETTLKAYDDLVP